MKLFKKKGRREGIIHPSFPFLHLHPFIEDVEETLRKVLPHNLLRALHKKTLFHLLPGYFDHLDKLLPLFSWDLPNSTGALTLTLLCHGENTHGIGRYLTDLASRWLVPGKMLTIWTGQYLCFKFSPYPKKDFFFMQLAVHIETSEDLQLAKQNLPKLSEELRLNLLSVKLARGVIATRRLSENEKKALVEENLASLLGRTQRESNPTSYDHLHQFWLKMDSPQKMGEYKAQFDHFLKKQKPQIQDRDIFYEVQQIALAFPASFKAERLPRHLMRIVAYQFLLKKVLLQALMNASGKRVVRLKFLRTKLDGNKSVIGIVGAMNIVNRRELFDEEHAKRALIACHEKALAISSSFNLEVDYPSKIRYFYIEIEKLSPEHFSLLQKNLPKALKTSVEIPLQRLFMPINYQEMQVRAQIVIEAWKKNPSSAHLILFFQRQAETNLIFVLVLGRPFSKQMRPLHEALTETSEQVIFSDFHTPVDPPSPSDAEITFFKASIPKNLFVRSDYSIDIFRARLAIVKKLKESIGDFIDYNGGLCAIQQTLFNEVLGLMEEEGKRNDCLLQNLFHNLTYSEKPLSAEKIARLFKLILEVRNQTACHRFEEIDGEFYFACSGRIPDVYDESQITTQTLDDEIPLFALFTPNIDNETLAKLELSSVCTS